MTGLNHELGVAVTVLIGGPAVLLLMDEYQSLRQRGDLERFALRAIAVMVLAAGLFTFTVRAWPWAFR
jgi:hypothetical protein